MQTNIYEQIKRKSKEFNSSIISNPQFLEHIITKEINIDDFDLIKQILTTIETVETNNKLSNLEEFQ